MGSSLTASPRLLPPRLPRRVREPPPGVQRLRALPRFRLLPRLLPRLARRLLLRHLLIRIREHLIREGSSTKASGLELKGVEVCASGLKPARGGGRRETYCTVRQERKKRSPQGTAFTTRTRSYGDQCKESERASVERMEMAFLGRSSSSVGSASGSFHTSECRGGVERRQLKLKGIEGGD